MSVLCRAWVVIPTLLQAIESLRWAAAAASQLVSLFPLWLPQSTLLIAPMILFQIMSHFCVKPSRGSYCAQNKIQTFYRCYRTLPDLRSHLTFPSILISTHVPLCSQAPGTLASFCVVHTPGSPLTEGDCLAVLSAWSSPLPVFTRTATFCDLDFSANVRSEWGLFWALKLFPSAH